MSQIFSVWQGVFNSFEEAGGDKDAWDTPIWINKQVAKINESLKKFKDSHICTREYPLTLIISMIIGGDACRVLDIGGSLGADYLDVMAKVPKAKDYLSYTIVEGEKLLSHMPADMKTFDNLQFYSSLDGVEGHFDIVHLGSSLQYIDRPFDFLTYLIDTYDPKFLVLSDIPASNIPSFVSHQIFYEKKIPYNFFNLEEFKDFFKNKFDLLYESKFIRDILNQEEIVPCSDLPKDHQIDCTKHFLWRKQ